MVQRKYEDDDDDSGRMVLPLDAHRRSSDLRGGDGGIHGDDALLHASRRGRSVPHALQQRRSKTGVTYF